MILLAAAEIPSATIVRVFLSLAVLLLLARFLGELFRRYGQPTLVGEILAGIILGPTLLGRLGIEWLTLFPDLGMVQILFEELVILSVTLLLLVAGLEVDLSTALKQGKAAVTVSAMGIFLPFCCGASVALLLPSQLGFTESVFETAQQYQDMRLPFILFAGVAMSITALPVIAKILIDLNMFKSDIGATIISAAMINDLTGWILFAVILALVPTAATSDGQSVWVTILLTLAFIGLMLTVGRWVFHRLMPLVQAYWSWPGGVISFVIVVALLGAAATEYIGIHSIFGAFIAGVAMGDSRHLRERTRQTIHQFINNIFAPIFFASIGLGIDFFAAFNPTMVIIVCIVAMTGKLVGCYFGASWSGMSRRESLAIGFGMVAQGTMGIILGELALTAGLIGEELFVAIVIMAMGTSIIAGPAITRVLQQKQKRRLGDLLADRQFVPNLASISVQGVIGELAQTGEDITGIPAEEIYEAVWEREQVLHTGLGDGLAVPHARFPDRKLKKPIVLVGISEDGIDFDAPDGRPARIISMLLTPEGDPTSQLELLDMVARAFRTAEARTGALRAKTYTEFIAAINLADAESEIQDQAKAEAEAAEKEAG